MQEGKSKASEDDDLADLDDEEESGSAKPLRTTFELNDTLFAGAEIEESDTVYLWLGVDPSLFTNPKANTATDSNRRTSCYHTKFQKPSPS